MACLHRIGTRYINATWLPKPLSDLSHKQHAHVGLCCGSLSREPTAAHGAYCPGACSRACPPDLHDVAAACVCVWGGGGGVPGAPPVLHGRQAAGRESSAAARPGSTRGDEGTINLARSSPNGSAAAAVALRAGVPSRRTSACPNAGGASLRSVQGPGQSSTKMNQDLHRGLSCCGWAAHITAEPQAEAQAMGAA